MKLRTFTVHRSPFALNAERRTLNVERYSVTGTRMGAPFPLTRSTRNFAGLVSLAFRSDQVDAFWILIERLSGMKSHLLAPFHLHHDRAFEHVDKSTRVMAVDWVDSARRVIHRDHRDFFAGDIDQGLGH
jgi:hypothetical protein